VLSACDAAPGLPDEAARPRLGSVSISPAEDSLATSAAFADIPLVLDGVLAADAPVTLRALVRYTDTDTLVAELTREVPAGAFQLSVPLRVPRGAIGSYAVSLHTESASGVAGDEAAAVFTFKASSLGGPLVSNVSVPASVTRGATRAVSVPIVATVTDPDGLANLATVLLLTDGAALGRLFDEGRTSRSTDERAGDGRYTAALSIPPGLAPGTYGFEVEAVDRSGLRTSAPFTLTVQ
jgi:hypothetical protein